MIRARRRLSAEDPRGYYANCDCIGLTGRWHCENVAPAGADRHDAMEVAREAGWMVLHGKWYCPACQRDGLTPKRQERPVGTTH